MTHLAALVPGHGGLAGTHLEVGVPVAVLACPLDGVSALGAEPGPGGARVEGLGIEALDVRGIGGVGAGARLSVTLSAGADRPPELGLNLAFTVSVMLLAPASRLLPAFVSLSRTFPLPRPSNLAEPRATVRPLAVAVKDAVPAPSSRTPLTVKPLLATDARSSVPTLSSARARSLFSADFSPALRPKPGPQTQMPRRARRGGTSILEPTTSHGYLSPFAKLEAGRAPRGARPDGLCYGAR